MTARTSFFTQTLPLGRSKGPAELHIDRLDSVFGPEYFEHGRVLITVARDIPGLLKVAHKLQVMVHERFGAVAEVILEHVKHAWWVKLHEATSTLGLQKGEEIPCLQVTQIPEGVRVHPYKRDQMPTLEVLLLWEDASGSTRGHCLHTVSHPNVPVLEDLDQIFEEIIPYFAKRWICVSLRLIPPAKGDFETLSQDLESEAPHDPNPGAGVDVTILACHPFGFARDQADGIAHVAQCQPVAFRGITDGNGTAKICFLPADVNKIQVAETESFYGTEVVVPGSQFGQHDPEPAKLAVELTMKNTASVKVHVFVMPRVAPRADDTFGIVDWAAETRDPLPDAVVEVTPQKEGGVTVPMRHIGDGMFLVAEGSLPEGHVEIRIECGGFVMEERYVMLLAGENEFYVPMRRSSRHERNLLQ